MILDKSLLLGDAQAITTSAASTNVIDTLAAGDAIKSNWFVVVVTTAFATAAGAATVTFQLQSDTAEGFTSSDAVTLAATSAISKDTLVAGYIAYRVRVPTGAKRYIRAYAVAGGSNISAGKVTWGLVSDPDINRLHNI